MPPEIMRASDAIHWGTFDLSKEPLGEPPERMLAEARWRGISEVTPSLTAR
jgi:hypothetical protein